MAAKIHLKGNFATRNAGSNVGCAAADAYAELYIKKDSLKSLPAASAALQQKVFDLHHISKDDFYRSYKYYSDKPDEMRIILDSVSAKAERNRNNVLTKQYKRFD